MQVVRLHERSSGLLSELEEVKSARSKSSLDPENKVLGQIAAQAAGASAADKELLLRQIDSLKEVS
jgi:hypothetical protein